MTRRQLFGALAGVTGASVAPQRTVVLSIDGKHMARVVGDSLARADTGGGFLVPPGFTNAWRHSYHSETKQFCRVMSGTSDLGVEDEW